MKQFKFFSEGISHNTRKKYLNDSCKELPNTFTEVDIKPNMFSPSVTKRLLSAKKHGTKIILKKIKAIIVGVIIINKDEYKKDMGKKISKINILKNKMKDLSLSGDVKQYIKCLAKISTLSNNNYLRESCDNILRKLEDLES